MPSVFRSALLVAVVGGCLLSSSASAQSQSSAGGGSTAAYPAAPGFDAAGSDPRAVAVADRVMRAMGGYEAWRKARYFAWGFFGGQYQIWDKYTGDFHWEKDGMVANYNLGTKQGHVYSGGKDVSATPAGQKTLSSLTSIWINNAYWLLMPFKLKDSGVTLRYKGPGTTMDGAQADVLRLTFKNVGDTPENGYEVFVSRASGLVEEWAYFAKATDPQPAFRRRWNGYSPHAGLLLAAGRSEAAKPALLDNVTLVQTLPNGLMSSTTPVARLK